MCCIRLCCRFIATPHGDSRLPVTCLLPGSKFGPCSTVQNMAVFACFFPFRFRLYTSFSNTSGERFLGALSFLDDAARSNTYRCLVSSIWHSNHISRTAVARSFHLRAMRTLLPRVGLRAIAPLRRYLQMSPYHGARTPSTHAGVVSR